MNPVLVLLILIGAGLLWAILSFSFSFFGKSANKLNDNVKNAMFEEEEKKKEITNEKK